MRKKINLVLVFGLFLTLQCTEDNSDCLSYGDIRYKYLSSAIVVYNDTMISHYVFVNKAKTINESDLKDFVLYYAKKNTDISFIDIVDKKYISIEDLQEKHCKYAVSFKKDSSGLQIKNWYKKF